MRKSGFTLWEDVKWFFTWGLKVRIHQCQLNHLLATTIQCPSCKGQKQVHLGNLILDYPCFVCKGKGRVKNEN